jgi:autophagy-related protein 9
MMASNILSRFLPSNSLAPSIYQDLRAHDQASDGYDVEDRAGLALDEENLGVDFHEHELHDADVLNGEDSRMTTESTAFLQSPTHHHRRSGPGEQDNMQQMSRSEHFLTRSPRVIEEDGDDDVPASLLVEHSEGTGNPQDHQRRASHRRSTRATAIPGPSNHETQARWEAARAHQRLHDDTDVRERPSNMPKPGLITGSAREKALWTWINVANLDAFVHDVYDYYIGDGIWTILLTRLLNLL